VPVRAIIQAAARAAVQAEAIYRQHIASLDQHTPGIQYH